MKSLCTIFVRATTRKRAGFSLTETLMALLILTIFSAMVAAAMPSVIRSYTSAVNASNAQATLSTTATALRDELGMALDVKVEGATVTAYKDGSGRWSKLSSPENSMGTGITKRIGDGENLPTNSSQSYPLVPNAAITNSLVVTYGGITYSDGVFTVTGLQVKDRNGNTLASIKDGNNTTYLIRAVGIEQ